jgi:hypothetical protein
VTVQEVDEGSSGCTDCGTQENLLIVWADLGRGAFIKVLCEVCWHRRQYRAELEERRARR